MVQYKIPQNIGIADKIVGPFTLKQMLIVATGGGISYVLFLLGSKIYELNTVEYIFIALPALLSIAFALLKINNVTLFKFLILSLEYNIKPKKRIWNHRSIVSIVDPNLIEVPNKRAKKTEEKQAENKKNISLRDLSYILDSRGFKDVREIRHEDMDEAEDDDLITEAFFGHRRKESATENMYWRTKESQKKRLDILAKMPAPKKTSPKMTHAKGIPKPEAVSGQIQSEKAQTKPMETFSALRADEPAKEKGKSPTEESSNKIRLNLSKKENPASPSLRSDAQTGATPQQQQKKQPPKGFTQNQQSQKPQIKNQTPKTGGIDAKTPLAPSSSSPKNKQTQQPRHSERGKQDSTQRLNRPSKPVQSNHENRINGKETQTEVKNANQPLLSPEEQKPEKKPSGSPSNPPIKNQLPSATLSPFQSEPAKQKKPEKPDSMGSKTPSIPAEISTFQKTEFPISFIPKKNSEASTTKEPNLSQTPPKQSAQKPPTPASGEIDLEELMRGGEIDFTL